MDADVHDHMLLFYDTIIEQRYWFCKVVLHNGFIPMKNAHKIPTLVDTVVSNKGRRLVPGVLLSIRCYCEERSDVAIRSVVISVNLPMAATVHRTVAFMMGSSPSTLQEKYAQTPEKLTSLTILGKYLSVMKMKQYKDYRWKDTEFLQQLEDAKTE